MSDATLLERLYQSEYARCLRRDNVPPYCQDQCPAIRTPLKPHQCVNVSFMLQRERDLYATVVGGFLLDDLGLGKTLSVIALIAESLRSVSPSHCTLIVVPANVLFQWEQQIHTHLAARTARVALYYGRDRRSVAATHKNTPYHILLTTYAVVRSEFDKRLKLFAPDSLFRGNIFDRVVLDEAHSIRNRESATSQAVCELSAERRWCVTATPIWNRITDYYPLFAFMRVFPLADWLYFRKHIVDEIAREPRKVLDTICEALAQYAIRHAKQEIAEIAAIRKHHERVAITLDEQERRFIDAMVQCTRMQVDTLLSTHALLREYSAQLDVGEREQVQELIGHIRFRVLSMITRLRQAADSPEIVLSSILSERVMTEQASAPMTRLVDGALQRLEEQVRNGGCSDETCAVCMDAEPTHALLPCLHRTCYTCFLALWGRGASMACPFCRARVEGSRRVEDVLSEQQQQQQQGLKRKHDNDDTVSRKQAPPPQKQPQQFGPPSSKTRWLLAKLQDGQKTVVFSQFLAYLDILQHHIEACGIRVLRIEGSVKAQERVQLQERFTNDSSYQVMLCSLGAGGQGGNLQVAAQCVLMEPWYNDALMQQGSDRVHRLGQRAADVYVYWLHARDTIEDRLYEMVERKQQLAATTLEGTSAATDNMTWAANIRLMLEKLPLYGRKSSAAAAAVSPDSSPRRRVLPASFFDASLRADDAEMISSSFDDDDDDGLSVSGTR